MPQAVATPISKQAAPPKQHKMPRWQTIAIALVTLVLSLAFLEFLFAVAGIGENEYLKIDPAIGFSPIPGKQVTWREEGFCRTVWNTQAMRDKERTLAKPARTYRIAVLGDSFVEGLQVSDDQTFCHLLEEKLNQSGVAPSNATRFEVLNFGVANYNLGQEYLRLKQKALAFNPDLVVMAVRPDTIYQLALNPQGGFMYASRPSFFAGANHTLIEDHTMSENWMKSSEAKRMKSTLWLREHSRIWGVVSQMARNLMLWQKHNLEKPKLNFSTPAFSLTKETDTVKVTQAKAQEQLAAAQACAKSTQFLWPIADAVIRQADQECKAHKVPLVLLRLPGPGGFRNIAEDKLLQGTVKTLNLPLCDLTEPFIAAQEKTGQRFFIVFHLDPDGHKLAAENIFQFLNANVFPSQGTEAHN
jgi:hypothetical protein